MDKILLNILDFSSAGTEKVKTAAEILREPQLSAGVAQRRVGLSLVCFSKGRPYQLHQFLLSIKKCFKESPDRVVVIYNGEDYQEQYNNLFSYHSTVEGVKEVSFREDLMRVVDEMASSYVMFCVDDLVFFRTVDYGYVFCSLIFFYLLQMLRLILEGFIKVIENNCFCVHTKLHPGISYSHSSQKVCLPPQPLTTAGGGHLLKYDLSTGKSDWRYPFDLCGSIYRVDDLKQLFAIPSPDSFSNPNTLEVYGNSRFFSSFQSRKRYSHALCLDSSILCVVTINQVQSSYKVPIYEAITDKATDISCDRHSLNTSLLRLYLVGKSNNRNNWVDDSINFDLDRYSHQNYFTVHVGDIFFQDPSRHPSVYPNLSTPQVTVIIPVYNGERYVKDCLDSLFMLDQGCPFEVIVVNDGSTDNTRTRLEEYQARLVSPNRLRIIDTEHLGLAHALDYAIAVSSTDFIARLDIDDCCVPERLSKQLNYLLNHPEITVVGGQATKMGMESTAGDVDGKLCITMKTPPFLVHQALHFSCPILHPSVMFRKVVIVECGGYRNQATHHTSHNPQLVEEEEDMINYIEDYYLWSRVLQKYPCSIANLSDVVIRLRVYSGSKSKRELEPAMEASARLQTRLLADLFRTNNMEYESSQLHLSWKLLCKPKIRSKEGMERETIQHALEFLQKFSEAFHERYLSYVASNEEIGGMLLHSFQEMNRSYAIQLLTIALQKFPDFPIPEEFQSEISSMQRNQLKTSILDKLLVGF